MLECNGSILWQVHDICIISVMSQINMIIERIYIALFKAPKALYTEPIIHWHHIHTGGGILLLTLESFTLKSFTLKKEQLGERKPEEKCWKFISKCKGALEAAPLNSHESGWLSHLNKCQSNVCGRTFWKLPVPFAHCFAVQNFFSRRNAVFFPPLHSSLGTVSHVPV